MVKQAQSIISNWLTFVLLFWPAENDLFSGLSLDVLTQLGLRAAVGSTQITELWLTALSSNHRLQCIVGTPPRFFWGGETEKQSMMGNLSVFIQVIRALFRHLFKYLDSILSF